MSYRDKTSFSMLASRELRHNNRVPKVGNGQSRVLPISAIYGANASGKSNFIDALIFARELITVGTDSSERIDVMPFLLEKAAGSHPSFFSFVILVEDTVFEYSFTITSEKIINEKLSEISRTSEKMLFSRENNSIKFGKPLASEEGGDDFLEFVFKSTRDNQLFLRNAVLQNVRSLSKIDNWFRNTLVLIKPLSRFASFELFMEEGGELQQGMSRALRQLDTGIEELIGEEIELDEIELNDETMSRLKKEVNDGIGVKLDEPQKNDRFIISHEDNKLVTKKLVAYHETMDNKEQIKFQINQESDGTQRLIDLLPAFLGLSQQVPARVFIIDEIGRSLHTKVLDALIEMYLLTCTNDTRSQLIFTTHNVQLMTQYLLRRDEMWLTDRDNDGITTLYSLSDFVDLKSDDDIRKRYLQGQLGGVPRIFLTQ